MAKKSVAGQMDMFELFGSVEELEENVKSVPELPLEEDVREGVAEQQAVMQKTFIHQGTKQTAVIAYLNYNKIYQKIWDETPLIYQFEQSKEAVDYYVSKLEVFSEDKQIKELKEQEVLMEAKVIPWVKE